MWLLNTLVILSVFGAIYGDADVKTEEGVLVLTTENFESVIKNNEHVLVEFCKYFVRCAFPLCLQNDFPGWEINIKGYVRLNASYVV